MKYERAGGITGVITGGRSMVIDPAALAARRQFMIRRTPDGVLEIKDGNGKKGGNLCGDEPTDLLLGADKTPLRDPVSNIDPN